jgi:glycosyltransferase involved in cell wall biosynthesis
MFVGTGVLDNELRGRIADFGLNGKVVSLGWRDDLARVMRCCDLYLHTGPERPPEGFGLAVVEAELAGLRLLVSEGVSDDALLKDAKVRRLPVAVGPVSWADAAVELLQEPAPRRDLIVERFKGSPLDLQITVPALFALYATAKAA